MSTMSVFMTGLSTGIVIAESSANGGWRVSKSLDGMDVRCLAKDPASSSTAYVGTRHDGLWRTKDYGRTWTQLGMDGTIITALAINPHNPDVIYAGTKPALLYRSQDGGVSWEELDGFRNIPNRWWWFSPADPPSLSPYIISVAVSPTQSDSLVAGVEFGGVFRSTDGGLTWSRHLRHALRDCHALVFHHSDGHYVYEAGGTGGGAALSTDGGLTWEKHRDGLVYNYGVVCAADSIDPAVWYVCVGQSPGKVHGQNPEVYLYRSTNHSSWQPIGWQAHPLLETPTALTTPKGRTGKLFAGLHNGDIWHSSDYGDTWQKMPFSLTGMGNTLLHFDLQT
ncbi:MAG: hypothetical protein PVF49_13705 [Anaerolineales bacterium]